MGVLDQVTQMKNQGIPQDEITNKLQEQGVSPKAINDAFNQSQIKDAVSKPVIGEGMQPSVGSAPKPVTQASKPQDIGGGDFYEPPTQQNQSYGTPSTQEYSEGGEEYGDQEYLPSQQEYYPQEGYGDYYESSTGFDTDTMIEIAEQVFSEKIRKLQKQLDELESFKAIAETKLNHTVERLKRIEMSIDKLQAAILEKVGSYGRGLDSIKKEMSMMQNSFSKMVPSLAHKSAHHATHKKPVKKKTVSRKKK